MMRMNNINMTTRVQKSKLLETLKKNLENHSKIVKEAVEGYVAKAKASVESRLEDLRKGRVVSLSFSLSPPKDYSEIYRSTISMLEWNTAESVELKPDEFRQLVEDKWDWYDSFLEHNANYSATAHTAFFGGIAANWRAD